MGPPVSCEAYRTFQGQGKRQGTTFGKRRSLSCVREARLRPASSALPRLGAKFLYHHSALGAAGLSPDKCSRTSGKHWHDFPYFRPRFLREYWFGLSSSGVISNDQLCHSGYKPSAKHGAKSSWIC